MREATSKQLWNVCRSQMAYKIGRDTKNHDLSDCSSGCLWFHELSGVRGMDWGVCFNEKSPRSGLLTFEHMGCKYFE